MIRSICCLDVLGKGDEQAILGGVHEVDHGASQERIAEDFGLPGEANAIKPGFFA
ncbi:MAG TPA: hypothetical protein VKM55_08195 [Candidatus Lokiarchaeia archaeon]|nr:hypothetical protein [Candidatus Lokiarchaeia archaeon]